MSTRLGPTSRDMIAVVESVVVAPPVRTRTAVREVASIVGDSPQPGRLRACLIKSGWSLNSVYYPASVLRQDASKWAKGCQVFIDHDTDAEEEARPAGSIKNLAGVLEGDARWNEATQSIEADIRLFQPWRAAITDMAPYIGMSIRAWVYAAEGEAEGRQGVVVSSIAEARSVDFVTMPAAGGAILSVLESIRQHPRRVAEATVEERRSQLHDEISEMWGDDQTYTWVRDFDLDSLLVWFDTCPADSDSTTWQQSYTVADDGDVELTGDRIEVVARTVYDPAEPEDEPEVIDGTTTEALATPVLQAAQAVTESVTDGAPSTVTDPPTEEESAVAETQTGAPPPVQAGTAPVATAPPTTPTAEATAANTAVLEAMQALTRQVTLLTESNATLVERANARDTEDRTQRNRQAAREAVAAALAAPEVPADLREQIGPRVTLAVLADVPTTDAGDLDAAALGEAITASIEAESGYAARLLESAGVGRPRGLGSQAPQQQSADEFEKSMAKKFEALGHSPEFAAIAGRGRG